MANNTVAAASSAKENEELKQVINDIHALSEGAFDQIRAISSLALNSLETSAGYVHVDRIAYALEAIMGTAENVGSLIQDEAAGVGCEYKDSRKARRLRAMIEAHERAMARV